MGWKVINGVKVWEDNDGNLFTEDDQPYTAGTPDVNTTDDAEAGVFLPEVSDTVSEDSDMLVAQDATGQAYSPTTNYSLDDTATPQLKQGTPQNAVEVGQANAAPSAVREFDTGTVTSAAAGRVPEEEVKAKGPQTIGKMDITGADITPAEKAYGKALMEASISRVMDLTNAFYEDPNYGPEVETTVKFINDNFDPAMAVELLDGVKERVDQEIQHLHSDIDNLMSQEINPNRIFANGSGVAAAIGVAVGAMSQAVLGPGTPNVAMQIVQSALERDMQAQRLELQRNQIGAGLRRDLISLIRQRGLDDLAAFDYLQAYARKVAGNQMAKYAAKDPKMAIEAMKLVKGLSEDWIKFSVQGNQKAAAKGVNITLNRRRNEMSEQISRAIAQPAPGGVAQTQQPMQAQQAAPVRATAQGPTGISKGRVASKRVSPPMADLATRATVAGPAAMLGQAGQMAQAAQEQAKRDAPIPGIPDKLQKEAKEIFDAIESTGLGTVNINGVNRKLFTPIRTVGGYTQLRNTWDIPNNKQNKPPSEVPLLEFQGKVADAAETVADQRHMIKLNRVLSKAAKLAAQGDTARVIAFLNGDEAEVLRTMSELGTLAKAQAFKKAMDNDEDAESMAKASNLDVETITSLMGGPGVPKFEEKAEGLMDQLKLITPAEIDGWNRALNRRHQNLVGKLQRKAPQFGVELSPFIQESLLSAATGAGPDR